MTQPDPRLLEHVVVARPTHPGRNLGSAHRPVFNAQNPMGADLAPTSPRNAHVKDKDVELDIRVCVGRSVLVDYINHAESSSWGKR